MSKCLYCGAMNEDNNKFCSNCGNTLNNSNISDFQQNNNQQQNYNRGQNDPRRINEQQHVNNQRVNAPQSVGQSRGSNDPRRIDEQRHVYNQPRGNTQSQTNNNQQKSYQNNNKSNGSFLKNLSKPIKIIGIIVLCCIGILVISSLMGGISDKGSLSSNGDYTGTVSGNILDSFSKSDCKEINYNQLNRNPDKYYGDNIKLSGRIMQISEGNSGGNYLLMYVNDNYDQLAYVEYDQNTNFYEDDWITVYGVGGGSYSYTTTTGGRNTVPSVYGAILE